MSSNISLPESEGVIVISSDIFPSEHFIQKILGVDTLPSANMYFSNIKGYPWKFDTKYYSADVILYAVDEKITFDSNFTDSVKATVLCFDSNKLSSFEEIQNWMPLLKSIESEVQLLVCDNCCSENDVLAPIKKDVLNWCIENHFELIELNPKEDSDDEDSIFTDVKGYARIIEALQSHTWANLVMKCENSVLCKEIQDFLPETKKEPETGEEKSHSSAEIKSEDKEASIASSQNVKNDCQDGKKNEVDKEELLLEEKWIENVLTGDDPGGESFEALFSKFASMKDRASGLAGEDRKKYAEKVAIAFWRAMGGDEDEIDGLDDE